MCFLQMELFTFDGPNIEIYKKIGVVLKPLPIIRDFMNFYENSARLMISRGPERGRCEPFVPGMCRRQFWAISPL